MAERSEPLAKQRTNALISLQVNAANLSSSVIEIEIAGQLVVLGTFYEHGDRRRRWRTIPTAGGCCRSGRRRRLHFSKMLCDVCARAKQSFLFAAPQGDANGATRLQPQCLNDAHGFHCDRDAGAIVSSARAGVP